MAEVFGEGAAPARAGVRHMRIVPGSIPVEIECKFEVFVAAGNQKCRNLQAGLQDFEIRISDFLQHSGTAGTGVPRQSQDMVRLTRGHVHNKGCQFVSTQLRLSLMRITLTSGCSRVSLSQVSQPLSWGSCSIQGPPRLPPAWTTLRAACSTEINVPDRAGESRTYRWRPGIPRDRHGLGSRQGGVPGFASYTWGFVGNSFISLTRTRVGCWTLLVGHPGTEKTSLLLITWSLFSLLKMHFWRRWFLSSVLDISRGRRHLLHGQRVLASRALRTFNRTTDERVSELSLPYSRCSRSWSIPRMAKKSSPPRERNKRRPLTKQISSSLVVVRARGSRRRVVCDWHRLGCRVTS